MDQAQRVVTLVREILADALVGAYLHGSAAVGALRPTSDIDLLVVARRSTTPAEKRALIERLLSVSGRGDPTGPLASRRAGNRGPGRCPALAIPAAA